MRTVWDVACYSRGMAHYPDVKTGVAQANGLRMHYLRAGDSGPLLLLLHGWPQTSFCWRHLVGPLSEKYVVVAPDLRGYGRTDKPLGGYDKRTMAHDLSALMRGLGYDSAEVVGHDRGARVAHRWGLDRAEEIERLVILDVIPTRAVFARLDHLYASRQWHWFFHAQPDLPERLVASDIPGYINYFFERWTYNRHAFDDAALDEYARAFTAPGAFRASMDDYRASFGVDLEQDDADHEAGHKLTMPVQVLWGDAGVSATIPTVDIWSEYAENVVGGQIADCGHFMPEERPREVLSALRGFLAAYAD